MIVIYEIEITKQVHTLTHALHLEKKNTWFALYHVHQMNEPICGTIEGNMSAAVKWKHMSYNEVKDTNRSEHLSNQGLWTVKLKWFIANLFNGPTTLFSLINNKCTC